MQINSEQALVGYADVYVKLYNRLPNELRTLDENWVVVNGARIHATELATLTESLEEEYAVVLEHKRNIILRLIAWFKK